MAITDNKDINAILSRLMDGRATDEELLQLLNWAKSSPANSRQMLAFIGIEDLISSPFSPEDIDLEAARESITLKIKAAQRKRWSLWMSRIAAVVAIPLLGFAFWLGHQSGSGNETPVVAQQTVQSPVGARSNITLPDGSTVCLNSASSLSFPAEFKGPVREVTLTGEGYFEVHSDKDHPFVVYSGNISTTATGTKFNVNAYGSQMSVALLEGRVAVGEGSSASTTLMPGQMLRHFSDGGSEVSDIDVETLCNWKDGIVSFRDDSLKYVFERLSQIYGVEFLILNPGLNDYLYRGTFDNKTLDQILNIISLTIPLEFSDKGFSSTSGVRSIEVSLL